MVINYGLSAPVPRRSKRAICSEVWVYRFVFLTTAAACHAGAQLGFESRQKEVATTATCRSRSATAVTLNSTSRFKIQDRRSTTVNSPILHQINSTMSTRTILHQIKMPRAIPRSFSTTAYLASSTPASHAYHIPHNPAAGPSRPPPPPTPTRATSEKPTLTPEEQEVIDRIVRVDQAGELGANWIYRGQKMAMGLRGDRKAVKQIDVCSVSVRYMLGG
jgi:hypothetical protein